MNPLQLVPARLRHRFPDGLAAAGTVPLVRPRTLAIVGSRDALPETRDYARHLAARAAAAGIVVVSGGATGIDTAAHEGAMAAGGPTWVVSPVPIGEVTPKENAPLFAKAAATGGAILTRQLRSAILKSSIYFKRNELLVALADALVVVQAGQRSGALNAAKHARDLGIPCWAVPGPPWLGAAMRGCAQLIDAGHARPLWRTEEVLAGDLTSDLTGDLARRASDANAPTQLALEATAVLRSLGETPMHLDDIVEDCSIDAGTVAVQLLTLAGLGVVLEHPPGWFRRLR
jgi:DNA processing protein